jgi:hypothetical protein
VKERECALWNQLVSALQHDQTLLFDQRAQKLSKKKNVLLAAFCLFLFIF